MKQLIYSLLAILNIFIIAACSSDDFSLENQSNQQAHKNEIRSMDEARLSLKQFIKDYESIENQSGKVSNHNRTIKDELLF
jgi:hypothetical protein